MPGPLNWGKIRAAVDFQERWDALNVALQSGDEHAIFRAWNPTHLYDAVDLLNERDRATLSAALQKRGRDERLASALASQDMERVSYARRELADMTATPPNGSDHESVLFNPDPASPVQDKAN